MDSLAHLQVTKKLQHKLSLAIHRCQLKQLTGSTTAAHNATILSASQPHAYRWLVNPLTDASYIMKPVEWKGAVRHRMYLPPTDTLPKSTCTHKSGDDITIRDNPLHFHVCEKLKKSGMYVRHQHVVKTLQRWCHHLGYHVEYEPQFASQDKHTVLKPDLLVYTAHDQWMIDVTVVEPSGNNVVTTHRSHSKPLAAANESERKKLGKYNNQIPKLTGINALTKFIPFVLESQSAIGGRAMDWLRHLVMDQPQPQTELTHILNQISTALQIGNAEVDINGINSLAAQCHRGSPIVITESDHVSEVLRSHVDGRLQVDWHTSRRQARGERQQYTEVNSSDDENNASVTHFATTPSPILVH
jgi:hypothetical protein